MSHTTFPAAAIPENIELNIPPPLEPPVEPHVLVVVVEAFVVHQLVGVDTVFIVQDQVFCMTVEAQRLLGFGAVVFGGDGGGDGLFNIPSNWVF